MQETEYDAGSVTIEACTDPTTWNAFVERTDGPAYALWEWGDAVESYGHERLYLLARRSGEPVGALPLFHIESVVFGSKLVSPPYAARGSIVLDETASDEVVRALLERTRSLADDRGVDFVSLRGAELAESDGFEKRNRFVTFRIPLPEDGEVAWENVKESRRRQITRAADTPLEYRAGTTLDDLETYYGLHLESMRGHGTPPHSFRFFRELWDGLFEDDRLHLGMIEYRGELVNGILELSLGSSVHQWGVVTDYEHRELNGGSLLLWKSLERALDRGYESYDMGRTREGTGVYTFKKSFGGTKEWYDDYHYFPNGEGSLLHPDDTYEPIKRVWRRLPIPVTRAIGPHVRKGISL